MKSPGRAAIFDMDGLLVDSEPLWHVAEVEIFGDLGVPLVRAETRSTKGMFVDEVTQYWYDRYPWVGPSPSEVAAKILSRVEELILERGRTLPGALEAVAAMSEEGPVALASSTPRALIDVVLDHIGLAGAFGVVCSAQDEQYGKPHPAVFLTAASQLEVVPERCSVFEDSTAGIIAAKAARMICVAVPEPSDRDRPEVGIADVVLDSLSEFSPSLLASYFEE
jgi:sugar-phosphatase